MIDILASLLIVICLFPLFLFLYCLVKLDSRGPFFFKQERLGYLGKTFKVYKIRTMIDKQRKVHKEVFVGNSEVTKVGGVLRRFKIDEIPQILNVLIGDMSLVGPRPGLVSQLNELDENGKFRLNVKPGLTGLAQVNGNIYLSWPERWKYDKYYVDHLSFPMDLSIGLKTILIVFKGEEKFINKPE